MKSDPLTGKKYKGIEYDAETVLTLLLIADCYATTELVDSWSQDQIMEAGDWAMRSHLKASDNNVRVPQKPEFLP